MFVAIISLQLSKYFSKILRYILRMITNFDIMDFSNYYGPYGIYINMDDPGLFICVVANSGRNGESRCYIYFP